MDNFPFTYLWLVKTNINRQEIKTILELGCGTGAFGDLVNMQRSYEITGVDIFEPYLKICREKGKYRKVYKEDLTKKFKVKDENFDAVVCLQTLEHLKKKTGLSLVTKMEKIAKRLVVISTPNGECSQEEYDNNKHQKHLSIWTPDDFTKSGYQVYGVGLRWVYGSHSHAQNKINPIKIPLLFFSFLMNPLANVFPDIGCQIVAVKIKSEK